MPWEIGPGVEYTTGLAIRHNESDHHRKGRQGDCEIYLISRLELLQSGSVLGVRADKCAGVNNNTTVALRFKALRLPG